jgi:aerobic carbon-monoxide dehydrogenase medium subunit
VIPIPFDYVAPESLDEALSALANGGEDAKVLAGGQSLVPMMNFRLTRPPALVDITRIPDLRYVLREDGVLRIGALTVHREVEHLRDPDLVAGYELLPRAARWVGHYPIRTRGTFGGSVAHADPSAEWCMLAVLLDATIVVAGPNGEREIAAADFFLGFFTTAMEPGELLVEVRFPRPRPHAALQEFARRHGDFAIVAAAAAVDLDGDRIAGARIVVGGVDEVPLRVEAAEQAVDGAPAGMEAFTEAGRAAGQAVEPSSDVHGSAEYRKELTAVLVRRALAEAVHRNGAGRDGDGR